MGPGKPPSLVSTSFWTSSTNIGCISTEFEACRPVFTRPDPGSSNLGRARSKFGLHWPASGILACFQFCANAVQIRPEFDLFRTDLGARRGWGAPAPRRSSRCQQNPHRRCLCGGPSGRRRHWRRRHRVHERAGLGGRGGLVGCLAHRWPYRLAGARFVSFQDAPRVSMRDLGELFFRNLDLLKPRSRRIPVDANR